MKTKKVVEKPVIWRYLSDYKIYTENKKLADKIAKKLKKEASCLYHKDGKLFAWDFVVPYTEIASIKKIKA